MFKFSVGMIFFYFTEVSHQNLDMYNFASLDQRSKLKEFNLLESRRFFYFFSFFLPMNGLKSQFKLNISKPYSSSLISVFIILQALFFV